MARYLSKSTSCTSNIFDIVRCEKFITSNDHMKYIQTRFYEYKGFNNYLGCYLWERTLNLSWELPRYLLVYYGLKKRSDYLLKYVLKVGSIN